MCLCYQSWGDWERRLPELAVSWVCWSSEAKVWWEILSQKTTWSDWGANWPLASTHVYRYEHACVQTIPCHNTWKECYSYFWVSELVISIHIYMILHKKSCLELSEADPIPPIRPQEPFLSSSDTGHFVQVFYLAWGLCFNQLYKNKSFFFQASIRRWPGTYKVGTIVLFL